MHDLIERIEAAKGGSRELDEEIAFTVFPQLEKLCGKFYINGLPCSIEHYTESLDAALLLVPEGWSWAAGTGGKPYVYRPYARVYPSIVERDGIGYGCADTPALALVAACLRAIGRIRE